MLSVISHRSLKNLKTWFLVQKISCMHWNMSFIVKSVKRLPDRWRESSKLPKQLPHWMRSVLLHLLQNATTMSVRKSMKKESLILKKAVTRSLNEWFQMICLLPMILTWMIRSTEFQLSQVRTWQVNQLTCVRLHWSHWWLRSDRLSRQRARTSVFPTVFSPESEHPMTLLPDRVHSWLRWPKLPIF